MNEIKERNFYLKTGLLLEALSVTCFGMGAISRQVLDSPKETTDPIYFTVGAVLCTAGLVLFWRARKNHLSAMNALNAPALINQIPTVQGTPPSSVQDVKLACDSQAAFFSRAKQAAPEVTLEIGEDKAEDKRVQNADTDDLSSSVSYIETNIETESNNAATVKNGLS